MRHLTEIPISSKIHVEVNCIDMNSESKLTYFYFTQTKAICHKFI